LERASGLALYESAGGLGDLCEVLGHAGTWQEVFIADEAESIWNRLHDFVEKMISDETNCSVKTQEMFLQLLAERRINRYIGENWSDAGIEDEFGRWFGFDNSLESNRERTHE